MRLETIFSLFVFLCLIQTYPGYTSSNVDSTLVADSTASAKDILKQTDPQPGNFNVAVSIFRMITGLILVVGLVILAVWGLKWLQNKRIGRGIPVWMKTVGVYPLGPKQHLYMVKVMDRYMLLGVTESNINLLSEVDENEAKTISTELTTPNSFGNTLVRQMNILAKRKQK